MKGNSCKGNSMDKEHIPTNQKEKGTKDNGLTVKNKEKVSMNSKTAPNTKASINYLTNNMVKEHFSLQMEIFTLVTGYLVLELAL